MGGLDDQNDIFRSPPEGCCGSKKNNVVVVFFNPLKNSTTADFLFECGLTSLNLTCGLQRALSAICIITSGYKSNE